MSKQLVVCLDRPSVLTLPHGAISSLALIFLRLAPDSRLQQMHCGKEVQCLPERCYCWADGERGQLIKIIERHHNGSLSHSLRMLFDLLPTHAHGWWAIYGNSFTSSQVQWQFICTSGRLPKIHLLSSMQGPLIYFDGGTPNRILWGNFYTYKRHFYFRKNNQIYLDQKKFDVYRIPEKCLCVTRVRLWHKMCWIKIKVWSWKRPQLNKTKKDSWSYI